MVIEVFMPRMTHDMLTGRLITWLKKEGDVVQSGEPLFEVETDKAVSVVESEGNGKLVKIEFSAGEDVPVGARVAIIGTEDENQPSLERNFISPIARRIAKEYQIDLSLIKGSGPRGRVVEADIQAFVDQQKESKTSTSPNQGDEDFDRLPLTQIQVMTGQRMELAVTTIPQFTLEVDVKMSEIQRAREGLLSGLELRVSYTAFLVRAVSLALKRHPRVNASFAGDHIRCFRYVNVGVAIAVPNGLLVPVIKQADRLSLAQLQESLEHLKQKAMRGVLSPEDLDGGTFTISNLGMYGIDRFTAIINPPQAAILAVGQMRDQVFLQEGNPFNQSILTLRLSLDHRVLDGAVAAPFLADLGKILENPYLMLYPSKFEKNSALKGLHDT